MKTELSNEELDSILTQHERDQVAKATREARAVRTREVLSHTVTDSEDGTQQTFTHEYEFTVGASEDGSVSARSVILGKVDTNFAYIGPTIDELRRTLHTQLIQHGDAWQRGKIYWREVAAAEARYDRSVQPELLVRGFNELDDALIFRALRETFTQYYSDHLDLMIALVKRDYKTDGAFRKAVRELMTAGKENARSEREEEYREADDKDDFYADNFDLLADGIVSAL